LYESLIPGFTAEVLSYSMLCQASAFHVDLMKEGLVRAERASDGRLLILPARDQQPPYFHVPPGQHYTYIAKSATYVPGTGYLPLTVSMPTLQSTVHFGGEALPDLYLSIIPFGQGSVSSAAAEGPGSELSARGRIPVGGIFINGQSFIVHWSHCGTIAPDSQEQASAEH
jgi:hypothetical protein